MPTWLHGALTTIREHSKAFFVFNLVFYGVFALGMVASLCLPDLQSAAMPGVDVLLPRADRLRMMGQVHVYGAPWLSSAIDSVIDLLVTAASSLLPETFQQTSSWTALIPRFAPDIDTFIPHSLTFTFKGEAYVLVAFAIYVGVRMSLWPHRYGLASRKEGLTAGAHAVARLSVFIAVAVLFASVYESVGSISYLSLPR